MKPFDLNCSCAVEEISFREVDGRRALPGSKPGSARLAERVSSGVPGVGSFCEAPLLPVPGCLTMPKFL
jgi:hypothetical protein